jgi:hypothetical protein
MEHKKQEFFHRFLVLVWFKKFNIFDEMESKDAIFTQWPNFLAFLA